MTPSNPAPRTANASPPKASPTGSEKQAAESALSQALLSGDRSAAEALARNSYQQIYASLLRWSKDPVAAQDLTQETYRRAWKALESYRGEARFSTWLHRIAYTTFLNSRRCKRPDQTSPEVLELSSDPRPTPLERSETKQRRKRLRQAVDTLPEPFRRTVQAHYWSEISVTDLAHAESVTVVAIRKRLRKAEALIRRALERSSESPPDHAPPGANQ